MRKPARETGESGDTRWRSDKNGKAELECIPKGRRRAIRGVQHRSHCIIPSVPLF